MSRFYLSSDTNTEATSTPAYQNGSDSEDESTLPFPTELPRSAFLTPHFDPSTYLSTLRNRHQTLEDLRSDLRARSHLLSKELLDLVNGNYEEFLSLGGDLRGGEEKVEEVRLGLLSFEREVQTLQVAVQERADEVKTLLAEKKAVRRDVVLGRALLEIDARIEELEQSLDMSPGAEEADDEDDEDELDDEDEATLHGIPVERSKRHAEQYLLIGQMVKHIGPQHPFLVAQEARLEELRKTILLDLAAALRRAKIAKAPDAILAIANIYGDLDASSDAIKVLKGS